MPDKKPDRPSKGLQETGPEPLLETPLTPAQVEFLEQWLADRQQRLQQQVQDMITAEVGPIKDHLRALKDQVATLQEAVAVLDRAAVKLGMKVGLRAHSTKVLCAENGGPKQNGDKFVFVARDEVGSWESFEISKGI
jgi:hypothetical protein